MKGNIIVTGDSRGLGAEIVKTLLEETEYRVIGISRSNATEIANNLIAQERYLHISYDLNDLKNIKSLYQNYLKPLGPIAGLVNNSAIAYDDIITNLNIENLLNMFNVNVYASMLLSKFAIRDMLLHGTKGSIVHITSVCAHTGYKGLSMYAASKGALESFSRTVAREWGEFGIRSNCVAPGFMETEMSNTISREQRERIYKRTSLKRETDPSSVAYTVVFLLMDNSASITGQIIHVDNGTI